MNHICTDPPPPGFELIHGPIKPSPVRMLLKHFRSVSGSSNLLAIECFLLCAEKPRTIAELEELTGAPNGRINVALRTLTPYWDPRKEVVVKPTLHLLQRRRRLTGKGHRYHLTKKGKELIRNPVNSQSVSGSQTNKPQDEC